jgi:hypothetical protein
MGNIKDSKESQGATGTGRGEVLLSILVKDGHFSNKGDITIFNKNMEIKSQNGRLAAFDSIDKDFTKSLLDKYNLKYKKVPTNLQELLDVLEGQDCEDFLIEFYEKRTNESSYKKVIRKAIKEFMKSDFRKKSMQNIFGKYFTKLYQDTDGWDGIIFFKESKNYSTTPSITIAYNEKDFENYINYSGLGFTNGVQPVYLTGNSK